jgi:hypothetical protein
MGVMLQPQIVARRRAEARKSFGLSSLVKTPCGKFEVAFVLCDVFNYCRCDQSCCSDPERGSEGIPETAEEFLQVPVLAAHFVGEGKWRKRGGGGGGGGGGRKVDEERKTHSFLLFSLYLYRNSHKRPPQAGLRRLLRRVRER